MKITRFTQSCLLVEEGDARILIDPSAAETERFANFDTLDAVLYTHEHSDHFDADLAQKFADAGTAIYANASTAKQMKSQPNIVNNRWEFKIADLKIKAIELPHCLMPDGSPGPQNTGYLINEKLFDPGDGIFLEGLEVDNMALPITGPDISMKDAFNFAKQLKVKLAIAVHYDRLGAHPEIYASFVKRFNMPFKLSVLANGESLEV